MSDSALEQAQWWALNMGYHSAKRPAEAAALKLWAVGYVNLRHYFGRYGYLYHSLPARSRDSELEAEQQTHRRAFGRVCNQCGRRRPKNTHYFCIDKRQKGGLKTICKICDKENRRKNNGHSRVS